MAKVDPPSGHDAATAVVTGLSASERVAATSSYFSKFTWEPHLVDPGQLTASAFFARVLAPSADADGEDLARSTNRFLDSVEIEIVDAFDDDAVTGAAGTG